MSSEPDVTVLLNQWADGNQAAFDALMPLVYAELHKLAKRYMERQASGHTLQTTAVINEAYLKLAAGREGAWKNRSHFFGVAAKAMRHVLVDYARSQRASKRGGEIAIVPLDEDPAATDKKATEVIALDSALTALAKSFPRQGQVVELRYFGGLSVQEAAHALNISQETITRDWKFARAFLRREMERGGM